MSQGFSRKLQELHPSHVRVHHGYISCKCCNVFSMGTSIHAQGTWSEPLRLCIREYKSFIANAVQGQIWESLFLEEFPASEDVLEEVMLM